MPQVCLDLPYTPEGEALAERLTRIPGVRRVIPNQGAETQGVSRRGLGVSPQEAPPGGNLQAMLTSMGSPLGPPTGPPSGQRPPMGQPMSPQMRPPMRPPVGRRLV
jgi:hypothetical protein